MHKKILLISNAYFPSIGGIENSLRHLAQEACASGDDVEIVVSDLGLSAQQREKRTEMVDGVLVNRYPLQPISNKLLGVFNIISSNFLLFQLLRKKRQESPDTLVIARFHFAALIASLVGFKQVRYLVPSIFSVQVSHENSESLSWTIRLRNRLKVLLHSTVQRIALRRTDVFVFSDTMKLQCSQLIGKKRITYTIVKPGVDAKRFFPVKEKQRNELKSQLNLPIDKPLILFVGRFVKAKGVNTLLNAIAKIETACHLILVGEGDELAGYKKAMKNLAIVSDVSIIPPLREVEDYYRCADMFVMSSTYEPLGQTILEAFASGLPVVAFKKSDFVNTATQELGMDNYVSYANRYSDVDLSHAIEEQFTKNIKLDRTLIAREANTNFSWNKLYNDLVNGPSSIGSQAWP
jgi:1,2-diacylglycerol 3-alpha-glucosyltransferase